MTLVEKIAGWVVALLATVTVVFLLTPLLVTVAVSFGSSAVFTLPAPSWSLRWYENYVSSPTWMSATATSFKAGFLTALLATPIGTLAAYGLFLSRFRFAGLVHLTLMTPIIVPVILVGIAVFYAYVQLRLVNSLLGIVIAHTMLATPIVMMIVTSALKSFDLNQERVARSLGASRVQAFIMVTMPQIRFSLVTAAILSFLTSFDEVIVAMFISGGENSTLTRAMFAALRDQIDPTIAAISTIMIVVTSVLLALSQMLGSSKRR